MRIGKLDNDELQKLILGKLQHLRSEPMREPQIGEDCAWINLDGEIAVVSCDPITSAPISQLGRLSVHVNCNDAAAAGAEPVGLLVTLLVPPTTTPEELERIAVDLALEASRANVDIVGGHTEVTDAVTRPVTNTAVIARCPKDGLMRGMQPGDDLVMTKWAGLEGSVIIAESFPDIAECLSAEQRKTVAGLAERISVVAEGRYAARHGASAMHDVTEGGVLGACWEMAHLANCGLVIERERIPIREETALLCGNAGIDPLRLISSGSMLIACPYGEAMASGLNEMGIPAAVIGHAQGETAAFSDGTPILPPGADELYRLFR